MQKSLLISNPNESDKSVTKFRVVKKLNSQMSRENVGQLMSLTKCQTTQISLPFGQVMILNSLGLTVRFSFLDEYETLESGNRYQGISRKATLAHQHL